MSAKGARAATVVAAMACLLAGCVDNDKSLVIAFASPIDENCEVGVQSGDVVYLPNGLLDIGHTAFQGEPTYWMFPQVENHLIPNFDEDIWELEAYYVQMRRGFVHYEWLSGLDIIEAHPNSDQFLGLESEDIGHETNVSGLVDPGGEDPGRLVTQVQLIPRMMGSLLVPLQSLPRASLELVCLGVYLRIEGETTGGRMLESNEFVFPIYFTNGGLNWCCLDAGNNVVGFPACYPGQDYNNKECPSDSTIGPCP